jgi:hypothetical protein
MSACLLLELLVMEGKAEAAATPSTKPVSLVCMHRCSGRHLCGTEVGSYLPCQSCIGNMCHAITSSCGAQHAELHLSRWGSDQGDDEESYHCCAQGCVRTLDGKQSYLVSMISDSSTLGYDSNE